MRSIIGAAVHSSIVEFRCASSSDQATGSGRPRNPRSFYERVEELMLARGMPVSGYKMADLAGVRQSSTQGWKKPNRACDLDVCKRISVALGCTVEWLLTERGPKWLIDDAIWLELCDLWPHTSTM